MLEKILQLVKCFIDLMMHREILPMQFFTTLFDNLKITTCYSVVKHNFFSRRAII